MNDKFDGLLSPVTQKYISQILQEELPGKLYSAGEFYAAGLLASPGLAPLIRLSLGTTLYFMNAKLTPWDGGRLYPCGGCMLKNGLNSDMGIQPEFSFSFTQNNDIISRKVPEAREAAEREHNKVAWLRTPHTVGGSGYTHSFINYRRILADGLNGYRRRVDCLPQSDFKDAMTIVLDGICCYHARCVELLKNSGAPDGMISALNRVPFESPRNIYEALAAWNFVYYVDGCDDPGGLDRGLLPYWKGEDIVELLREFYRHVDANDGWSIPLGPNCSGLTVQCIDAAHNIRRPQIQLLVTDGTPDEVWEAVYGSLATSCGQPALYNWENYKREISSRIPEVREEDLMYLAFGGCTETMIEGLSNVGSDDAGINTALIFDGFFRENLGKAESFGEFLDGFIHKTQETITEVCGMLDEYRRTRALYRPQPIRTLFIDDCIDTMTEFNAGGARYNWSVINVAGLINVIDSMVAVKRLVFEEKKYSPEEFIALLDARDPELLALCAACPKHGNDDPEANAVARALSENIYPHFEKHACVTGGRYFPVSNQFTTYESAGFAVRATPDGRENGAPLCDSCGAVAGRDKKGPTALLNSVAEMDLRMVLGTPITNIRISKENLPRCLRPLTTAFFKNGGVQLQVTCASREELLDAMKHPEKHESLVVRIGGFSEYFNRLSPALKNSVIARTEY